ncbi:ATP-binding protein [Nocardioides panacisoli]|uniref:BTAD domain-containing putative transcriptional regulator n=1 Tax=Nocardioides panacisoli TaxID=627624 RepID=A0ABP7IZG0_9ACTN
MTRLRVLDDVTWDGASVPGERTHALLRALVRAGDRGLSETALVDEVWADDTPANPAKALQVVVSRARSATSPAAIERTARGYRLALGADDVDVWSLRPEGLRLAAEEQYADALPLLERAPADDAVTAALLRSVAAVHGVPAALERFEAYRSDLAERLGTDPSPELRDLHAELLAADRPVRTGVHHYASSLVGRDRDLIELRNLLREHRVVSILGPGGLGKTRLANLVAAGAEQPVVHVVELVGVTDPDDLVSEVGSVLGVRDSVADRRVLTQAQLRDVRSRIAHQLDVAPTLLVLDNCEHLVEAVADLVAFLVASAPRLRVLTTTRAPLAIAAEMVFPLGQLQPADAAELFRQRARAARPGVSLPPETVQHVVDRLDGLPLAIELAAVKVRVMSVQDIGRRLEDRFGLLRGGDRSAPDRHQTLLAVIDWSWNLLAERERRALRRLSVFHDGFDAEGAEAVVGMDALDAVADLVDQSLLNVVDATHTVRYRMLETVREFGRLQLLDAGEEAEVAKAQRDWAVAFCAERVPLLFGSQQVRTVAELRAEDGNLTDALRQALADSDPATVASIFAALGGYWSIVGDHQRSIALAAAVGRAVVDWEPPDELVEVARITLAMCLFGATFMSSGDQELREAAQRLGTDTGSPQLSALLTIMMTMGDASGDEVRAVLGRLVVDPNPKVRATAYTFLSHERENFADPRGAIDAARQALPLLDPDDGPWLRANLHSQLCGLYAQIGDLAAAGRHAAEALPGLEQLGALDDVLQVRAVLAMAELDAGRVEEAARISAEIEAMGATGPFGSRGAALELRGQLRLAQGRVDAGLAAHREAVAAMRELRFPSRGGDSDLMPWAVVSEGVALATYARHATGDEGRDLYLGLTAKAARSLEANDPLLDFPVNGVLLFACGLWALLREELAPEDAIRLLVLADRFAYPRSQPEMRWRSVVEDAERIAPGAVAAVEQEYGDRRGPALLDEARAVVQRLFG